MAKLDKDSNILFASTLDDIAWTLNLRGSDIEFNPVFFSYMLIHRDGDSHRVSLFINQSKVGEASVQTYLQSINVTVYDYNDVEKVLRELIQDEANKKLTISTSDCSAKMNQLFKEIGFELIEKGTDLIALIKANKNEVQ